MEMDKKSRKDQRLTLKTKAGCTRILAICMAVILLCGLFARLLSTDGGNVKITRIKYDTRGASVDADLYYPAGTDSHDKLPAVVVAHGGGVAKGVTQGLAEEFARRGYVVLNVSAYGAGTSEQPNYDDFEMGEENFIIWFSACGVLDAVEYVRTLEFVDQTRIGIVGHSLGALRAMVAAIEDCGYYTLNDMLINVLYDTFGQQFTYEEIGMDASELAKSRLNEDQLAYFEKLKEECTAFYNTRIKSICLLGTDGGQVISLAPVQVGGHEILRNVQTNFSVILANWDHNVPTFVGRDKSGEYWHETEEVVDGQWYVLDTYDTSATQPGMLFETSVRDNEELKNGIENRAARVFNFFDETHSKNFFSVQSAEHSVEFITETLGYNGGELGESNSKPVDSGNIIYIWREILTLIAMLAMVAMLFPVVGLVIQIPFFAEGVPAEIKSEGRTTNKRKYWIFSAVTVVLGFVTMYITNKLEPPMLPAIKFLPFFPSWWLTVLFVAILAVASVIFLVIYAVSDKKAIGKNYLSTLNFNIGLKNIFKALIVSVIVIAVAYMSFLLLQYLFNEDYRFWMAAFTEMRAEYWRYLWRYAILMLPCFLAIGAATNYSLRTDIPQWKDTLYTVIINSLGVWLLCLVNYLCLRTSDVMFSSFISSYGFLIIVPITVYITRKMYLVTKSIWYGAMINAFMLSWNIISCCGLHCDFFYGQNWLSNFLGM